MGVDDAYECHQVCGSGSIMRIMPDCHPWRYVFSTGGLLRILRRRFNMVGAVMALSLGQELVLIWLVHIPSNRAEMLTPRASASTLIALMEGFAPPVSMRDM